jgi:quercetin dioxygenase-like cupin family protein
MRPILLPPGEGARVANPLGGEIVFKLESGECGGATTVFETAPLPGEGPPMHLHESQDEWILVLDGTFRFLLGDEMRPAPAGTFVFLPRRFAHTWQNVGPRPGRRLIAFVPPALEGFFRRFAALPDGEATPEAFRALAAEAEMVVVGPPLAVSHPIP